MIYISKIFIMNFIISTIILLPLVGVYFVTAIDVSDLYKDQKIKYIGIKPGEKLHEELISSHESLNTLEYKDYYVKKTKFSFHIFVLTD